MKSKMIALTAALALGGMCTLAWAATPAETVIERQNVYKAVGRSNKAIRDELQKPTPSLAVIRTNAAILHRSARRTGQLFSRGTGQETGVRTSALPNIWTQFADFRSKHIQFVSDARDVERASRGNNIDTVKVAMQKLGGNCKGCHDMYKSKD
jgi:cytochrome c556